jgi:hypothetical protein
MKKLHIYSLVKGFRLYGIMLRMCVFTIIYVPVIFRTVYYNYKVKLFRYAMKAAMGQGGVAFIR